MWYVGDRVTDVCFDRTGTVVGFGEQGFVWVLLDASGRTIPLQGDDLVYAWSA